MENIEAERKEANEREKDIESYKIFVNTALETMLAKYKSKIIKSYQIYQILTDNKYGITVSVELYSGIMNIADIQKINKTMELIGFEKGTILMYTKEIIYSYYYPMPKEVD